MIDYNQTVGVAIPHIPVRPEHLARAVTSIAHQTRRVDAIAIAVDLDRCGAAHTRNRAWRQLDTDYVLFLDDDDELEPECVERLLEMAVKDDADLVFPHFTVIGGTDPFPEHLGRPWNPEQPRQTTIVCLWRRDALLAVDGFPEPGNAGVDRDGNRIGEDYAAVCNLNSIGGRIVHVPERLFRWHHWCFDGHIGNTSGLPDRW